MTYRELINTYTNEELAQILANDDLFNMACVENFNFDVSSCKYQNKDCYKCILALLDSEVEEDILKRNTNAGLIQ